MRSASARCATRSLPIYSKLGSRLSGQVHPATTPSASTKSPPLRLLDSFDLQLAQVRKTRGPKSQHWSAQLKRPGRRFQHITDVNSKIAPPLARPVAQDIRRALARGHKRFMATNLADTNFLSGSHYGSASKLKKFKVTSKIPKYAPRGR